MRLVNANHAPKALGPYSHGVSTGELLFTSGQIGIDPDSGELREGLGEQTRQVLANLEAVLEAGGSEKGRVIKTVIFLSNIEYFKEVNEIYGDFFSPHKPARSTVEAAALPMGALVEIEAVALCGAKDN